jgi:hypothetical protein
MSTVSFQAILDKALADYSEQLGVEPNKHPFVNELQGRDSPDDVLKLLEDKAKAFKVYRDGNRKLINWLSPVVQVIHTLSGVLSEAVSPTSRMRWLILLTFHHSAIRCLSSQQRQSLLAWMF